MACPGQRLRHLSQPRQGSAGSGKLFLIKASVIISPRKKAEPCLSEMRSELLPRRPKFVSAAFSTSGTGAESAAARNDAPGYRGERDLMMSLSFDLITL